MNILAIETSCDETAVSIIEAHEDGEHIAVDVLANIVHSQIDVHKAYGGVFPALAKREHGKNLVPVLTTALIAANMHTPAEGHLSTETTKRLSTLLEREPELLKHLLDNLPTIETPPIDAIAVTYGPGLEPALWVGINFAKALAILWDKPLVPVNHMEGHIFAGLLEEIEDKTFRIAHHELPLLALLVSGGHTELVMIDHLLEYRVIGQTRDDAVGEAFDKVARMLGLPYPGGPEVAQRAEVFRAHTTDNEDRTITLPRPMLTSDDYDFSFSGLKTAVLTIVKKHPEMSEQLRDEIAYEFQEAATEVLVAKTIRAVEEYGPKAVVIGGGVSANTRLCERLRQAIDDKHPQTKLFIPRPQFTTDNALMIALAGFARYTYKGDPRGRNEMIETLKAEGTVRLGT